MLRNLEVIASNPTACGGRRVVTIGPGTKGAQKRLIREWCQDNGYPEPRLNRTPTGRVCAFVMPVVVGQ